MGALIEPILSWLCIIGMGGVMVWAFYAGIIKPTTNPTPTTTQVGGVSNNYTIKNYPCGKIFDYNEPPAVKPVADKAVKAVKSVVPKAGS